MGLDIFGDDDAADAQIRQLERSTQAQLTAQDKTLDALETGFQRARNFIQPLQAADPASAINKARALIGAGTPQENQEAINNFRLSPAAVLSRDESIKAANRAESARGGLGSGSLLRAVTEIAGNTVLSDVQNSINNLLNIGNFDAGINQSLANLATRQGGANAQVQTNIGNLLSSGFDRRGQIQAQEIQDQSSRLNSALSSALIFAGGL